MNVRVGEFLGLVLQINYKKYFTRLVLVLVNDRKKLFKNINNPKPKSGLKYIR